MMIPGRIKNRWLFTTYCRRQYCYSRDQPIHRPVPVIEAARTIKQHWEGVLSWFAGRLNTGLLEGINSLIQAARARGYRTNGNLITMAYLIARKLEYGLPT